MPPSGCSKGADPGNRFAGAIRTRNAALTCWHKEGYDRTTRK